MDRGLSMKGILITLLVGFSINCTGLLACDMSGETGIAEENNLWIGPDQKTASTIDQATFNTIIDDVSKFYGPVISNLGGQLKVNRLWSNGTVNAYAQRRGRYYEVSMFGGLARHDQATPDAFALVLCHELGHHLGGIPQKSAISWASSEGQSDYFGTLKCLRMYMEGHDNIKIVSRMKINAKVKTLCDKQFTDKNDAAICMRSSMAGKALASVLAAISRKNFPNFNSPDRNVVKKHDDKHPHPQCRLDTYFAGAVCDADKDMDVSDSDINEGVCSRSWGDTEGVRPKCWFKP
jgi:hypothetical protein